MKIHRQIILSPALILVIFVLPQISSARFKHLAISSPCKKRLLLPATGNIPAELLKQSVPIYAFERSGNNPAIIFSRTGSDTIHHPTIFVFLGDTWRLFDLDDECFFQTTNWVYVARYRAYVWGIIDTDVEGRGWALEIVFSRDGGRSWRHVSSLKKPYYLAEFSSLRLGLKGRGELTVYLDENYGTRHRAGYYTYRTWDWGQRWTGGQYSSSPNYQYAGEDASDRGIGEVMQELARKSSPRN